MGLFSGADGKLPLGFAVGSLFEIKRIHKKSIDTFFKRFTTRRKCFFIVTKP